MIVAASTKLASTAHATNIQTYMPALAAHACIYQLTVRFSSSTYRSYGGWAQVA